MYKTLIDADKYVTTIVETIKHRQRIEHVQQIEAIETFQNLNAIAGQMAS